MILRNNLGERGTATWGMGEGRKGLFPVVVQVDHTGGVIPPHGLLGGQ